MDRLVTSDTIFALRLINNSVVRELIRRSVSISNVSFEYMNNTNVVGRVTVGCSSEILCVLYINGSGNTIIGQNPRCCRNPLYTSQTHC